jgi:hypothetical protein
MRLPRLWTDGVLHTDIVGHRLGERVQPLALPFLPLGQASLRLCQFLYEDRQAQELLGSGGVLSAPPASQGGSGVAVPDLGSLEAQEAWAKLVRLTSYNEHIQARATQDIGIGHPGVPLTAPTVYPERAATSSPRWL